MATDMVAGGARQDVLRRIRVALNKPLGGANGSTDAIDAEWQALPRGYKRAGTLGREEVLELLEDRLRDYDAHVVRVAAADVSDSIGKMLAERGKKRVLMPAGFAEMMGGEMPAGCEFVVDAGLDAAEINTFEGVLTASTVAIAETGTIVLQNVPGQGRRVATLVPDYHLCVVSVEDVVETVPEAMARLAPTSNLATTFVSGPSATADIEMTRIKGVHGPRFLDVLLVE